MPTTPYFAFHVFAFFDVIRGQHAELPRQDVRELHGAAHAHRAVSCLGMLEVGAHGGFRQEFTISGMGRVSLKVVSGLSRDEVVGWLS
jgi:hypothetical protein